MGTTRPPSVGASHGCVLVDAAETVIESDSGSASPVPIAECRVRRRVPGLRRSLPGHYEGLSERTALAPDASSASIAPVCPTVLENGSQFAARYGQVQIPLLGIRAPYKELSLQKLSASHAANGRNQDPITNSLTQLTRNST